MIEYTTPFKKRTFYGESLKEAYTKAMKWYATYVVKNQKDLPDVMIKVIKKEKADEPQVDLILYCALSEDELRKRHCKICKEVNQLFYIKGSVDCSICKIRAYQNRADEMSEIKKKIYKEKLFKFEV